MSAELRSYNDKLMPDNRRRVLHTPCNREVIDENNNGEYVCIIRHSPTHAITYAARHVVYRHCILFGMSALFSPPQIYTFRTLNQVKNCAIAPIFTVKFLARLNAEKSTRMGAFFISVRLSWNPHPS